DRQTFPELPTGLDEREDLRDYLELNEVVIKACEGNAHKRYHTAEQMHADLLLLQAGKSVKRLRLLERRLALLSRIGLGAGMLVLTGLLVVAAAYYQANRDRRKARQNLAVSHVAYGTRLMDEGDLLGALPSFAEALRLERDDAERERRHRVHLGVVLRQCPKLTRLWFHDGRINAANFSPDGRRVVVAGVNGNAAVWDAEGSLQIFRLVGHRPEKEVESACYSSDGRFLLTAGEDGLVRIWNAENGEEIAAASPLLHPDTVYNANFNRRGDRIVTACKDGKVRVWTMGSNSPIREFVAHAAPVRHASFSPDGRRIVTASIDETAKVWNADTGAQLGETMRHDNWVYDACFSPDGLSIVTASYDKTSRIWDATTGKLIATLHSDAPVRSARFSPDGRYIVTTCWDYDFAVRVWDASTGQEAFPPLKHTSYPFTASFSPQGHRILTACANGVCQVWDLAGNKWTASSTPVFYSPNGNVLVTLEDGVLQARNAATGAAISPAIRPGYRVLDVKLNQDGSRLLTVTAQAPTEGKKVMFGQLWEVSTGQASSPLFSTEPSIINASLSVAGHRMVVTAGTVVQVCNTSDGKTLSVLSHSGPVNQAALSSDASRAVTIAGTNAHLWNAITGVQLRTWPHASEVGHAEFSSGGRLVVTCSGPGHMTKQYAQLWDGRTGERIGNPLWHIDGVLHASFSPDENRLVTASEDRSAVIWETATGRMVGLPLIHKHQVIEARFSPNGRWVVTLDIEDTVQVWDAAGGTPITPRLKHPFPVWSVQFIADGGRIIAKDAKVGTWVNWHGIEPKGYASWRVWDLTPDSRPTDELMLLGQLLSGHKSEQIGGGLPPETEALRIAWQTLTRGQPSEFTVSPTEIAAWHRREAEASEKAGQWSAAVFHWDHLIRTTPDEQAFRDRRTTALKRLDSDRTAPIK
ncbi:MAG TPA: WD40 repeat domain-containing protein, partial [Verrucomicrobiae bacterium]|nr:WD40 repeat domain-containing protein [Verrucomicrobiae bacterium]